MRLRGKNMDKITQEGTARQVPYNRREQILIIVLALVAASCLAYIAWGQYRTHTLAQRNSTLAAESASLDQQIKKQNDINNGIAKPNPDAKTPGAVHLLDGNITFKLPDDWVEVSVDDCRPATRLTTLACQDVAAIAPKSMAASDGTAKWSVKVSVFEFGKYGQSLLQWLADEYFDVPLYANSDLYILESNAPINGYEAQSVSYVFGDDKTNVLYFKEYYSAVAHKDYAVVVDADVYESRINNTNYDYSPYLNDIKSFVASVRYKE